MGCGSNSHPDSFTRSVQDADGVRANENGTIPQVWGGTLPYLILEDIATIGVSEGREEYMISMPSRWIEASHGPDQSVAYIEESPLELRVYDSGGQFLLRAGREGEGPGEFRGIRRPSYVDSKGWIIYDPRLYRLVVFSQSGRYVESHPVRDLPRYRGSIRELFFTDDGDFWYIAREMKADEERVGFHLFHVPWSTLEANEVSSFEHPIAVDRYMGDSFIETHPFSMVLDNQGRIWTNYDLPYEFEVYDVSDGLKFRVRREHTLEEYTPAYRRAVEAQPALSFGDGHYAYLQLPPYRASIQGLNTTGDHLWVFTTTYIDSPLVRVDVFDMDGVYQQAFVANENLITAIIEGDHLWRTADTEDGVPQLIRSRFKLEVNR